MKKGYKTFSALKLQMPKNHTSKTKNKLTYKYFVSMANNFKILCNRNIFYFYWNFGKEITQFPYVTKKLKN